jgi:hypothetical protein
MKKFKLFIASLLLLAMAATTTALFASDSTVVKTTATVSVTPITTLSVTPVPSLTPSTLNWADYFASTTGVITLIVLITGFTTKNLPSGQFLGITFTHWVSYVICFGICFIGYWQNLGIFNGITAGATALDGLSFGLTANGIATLPIVSGALQMIGAKNKV